MISGVTVLSSTGVTFGGPLAVSRRGARACLGGDRGWVEAEVLEMGIQFWGADEAVARVRAELFCFLAGHADGSCQGRPGWLHGEK